MESFFPLYLFNINEDLYLFFLKIEKPGPASPQIYK